MLRKSASHVDRCLACELEFCAEDEDLQKDLQKGLLYILHLPDISVMLLFADFGSTSLVQSW